MQPKESLSSAASNGIHFMISRILSRYRPRYIRSLLYMLQACEYNVRDYLAWYGRVQDFSRVEHRKTLVKTPKVYVLYASAYAIVVAIVAFAYYTMAFIEISPRIIVLACTVLLTPYILAYAVLIPLMLMNIVQAPVEYMAIRRAGKKLARHKGLKIAIAGSFGKTSMREILKTVLSEGLPAAPGGTAQAGKKVAAPPFSYNTPLAVAGFVEKLKGDEEVLIFELGEYYPGDVMRLCKCIDPHVGIITGVNEAHLEKFGTLEKTAATVFELAEYLKKRPVYINGESEIARTHAKSALKNHIVYSREGAGDCRVENPKSDLRGTTFGLVLDGVTSRVKTRLLGLHSIGPLAVSAHIASRLGLSRKQIDAGIAKTKAFSHRLEPHEDKSGVVTLDDSYNGNPDGVRAIIEFLELLEGRRRWYVTPGLVEMGPRTVEVHKEIGRRIAQAQLEKVILITNSVTPYIERGLREAGYTGEIIRFNDALQAYAALPHLTAKGDIVILQNDWPDQYS